MSRDQNAGRNHSVRTDKNIFERVEEFIYLGTTFVAVNNIRACWTKLCVGHNWVNSLFRINRMNRKWVFLNLL
jgi:hypothetical protein